MPQFAVVSEVRNTNVEAPNEQSAVAQATAALSAAVPAGYVVADVRAEAPALAEGDWVLAKRPDLLAGGEREAYAKVVKGGGGPGQEREVEFGDGLKRGLGAVIHKVPK